MLVSSIVALGSFYNDPKDITDKDILGKLIPRLTPTPLTRAATSVRFPVGPPFGHPHNPPTSPTLSRPSL